jgi:hypothetical protein
LGYCRLEEVRRELRQSLCMCIYLHFKFGMFNKNLLSGKNERKKCATARQRATILFTVLSCYASRVSLQQKQKKRAVLTA